MNPDSRKIILRNKDYLSKSIDLDKLKPFLEKLDIFTYAMLDDIYNFPSDYDFFIELTTRGPDALDKFRQVLKEAGYSREARIFETNNIYSQETRAYDTNATYFQGATNFATNFSKKLCYKMNSKPYVGFCFIINNVEFKTLDERFGSDVDAEALELLFTKLGYKVKCERNLTADKMEYELKEFSKADWSTVDSCVIIILSHGDNMGNLDIIYGTHEQFVRKIKIYEIFDNVNCEPLKYKPKLFFFQACRGSEEDYGVFSADAAKLVENPKVKIPTMSNLMAVHSSLPNHKSYRDHAKGTFFCQDLIEVFSLDYLYQDLETMLKTVALKLESRLSSWMRKQVLHIDNFGIKAAVYFCMKNVADICEIYDPRKR